jgi:hypothetical protein
LKSIGIGADSTAQFPHFLLYAFIVLEQPPACRRRTQSSPNGRQVGANTDGRDIRWSRLPRQDCWSVKWVTRARCTHHLSDDSHVV